MLKINSKIWVFVGLICLFQSVFADQQIDDIHQLIKTDPESALVQAEAFWQGKSVNSAEVNPGILLMNAMIANKQFEPAKDMLDQFLALADLSDTDQIRLLAQKVHWARKSKSKEDMSATISQAEALIEPLKNQLEQQAVINAFFELNQAVAYKHYFAGEITKAEPYYIEALKYVPENKHQNRSDLLNGIGVVKAQQADLAGAAEYMLKSIEVLEDNDLLVNPSRYQNLGSLNFMLKNWDKTIEYSEKALSLHQETDKLSASLLSNMAAAYVEKGELETAIQKLDESIKISEELDTSTSSARQNLGYIYNELGSYEEALEQLRLSRDELIKNDREEELSVTYKTMADVYANMQNFERAIELYEQALQLHQANDYKMKRVELYPKMVEVLVKQNNFEKAYEMMVDFKNLNDEITNVESTEKVNEILAAYEVEKNERALADSELERAKQQSNIALLEHNAAFNEKLKYLMFALLLGLVIILGLIYRSWRFRGRVNQILLDKNQRIEEQHKELQSLNHQLKDQTELDVLTGLKNRRYLTQMIAGEIAKKAPIQKQWCLIIIDLDNFKFINDNFGHQRGDEVLIKFAGLLEQLKSSGDVVARWGGEEFLWLTEIDSIDASTQKCDMFQAALAKTPWFRGDEVKVTCSMGFSSFPLVSLNFEDWEAALRLADYGLYQAKNSGKNSWCGFSVLDHQFDYQEIKNIDQLLSQHQIKKISKK